MNRKSDISRMLSFAGRYRYFTYLSCFVSGGAALLSLVPFFYIRKIIETILFSNISPAERAAEMTNYGVNAVLYACASFLMYSFALFFSHVAAFHVDTNIRRFVMSHVISLPMGIIEQLGTGKIRKTVDESGEAVHAFLAHNIPDSAAAVVTPVGLLCLMFFFDSRLAFFCLGPVLLAIAALYAMMKDSAAQERMKEYMDALDDMSNEAVEYIRGVPVVKTFGQTVFSFSRFKKSIDRYCEWVTACTVGMRSGMLFFTFAANSVYLFLVAGVFFTEECFKPQFLLNVMFFIVITPLISVTLTRVIYGNENKLKITDVLARIDTILSYKPLQEADMPVSPTSFNVEYENVSFSYDGGRKALENFSLRIREKERIALVGPSGGGKTTAVCLLARFFDPSAGRIMIGGTDLRDISSGDLTGLVSFVLQDSRLIRGTLKENILLGNPSASEEDVRRALTLARCDDIVEKLPDGLDTLIGTGGIYLSGGEVQRIAIARVICRDTPIVILDEATAYADPDNEMKITEALKALAREKTVIMIAHRLSSIPDMDRICVLDNGRIVESGTLDELLACGGMFAGMWNEYNRSVSQNKNTEGR